MPVYFPRKSLCRWKMFSRSSLNHCFPLGNKKPFYQNYSRIKDKLWRCEKLFQTGKRNPPLNLTLQIMNQQHVFWCETYDYLQLIQLSGQIHPKGPSHPLDHCTRMSECWEKLSNNRHVPREDRLDGGLEALGLGLRLCHRLINPASGLT